MITAFLAAALVLGPSDTEIVAAKGASKVVRFAAAEAKTFLSEVLGAEIPVVAEPTPGKASLVLGTNAWSAAAGLSVDGLPRDAFTILVKDGRVFIAGEDDPKIDPAERIRRAWWGAHNFHHATLNGVYTFLERAAGIRFYFSGELGTCVPRKREIRLPEGRKTIAPDLLIRTWSYFSDGKWPVPLRDPKYICPEEKALNVYRWRGSTGGYTCCHGLNGFRLVDRFKDTHPEYFALLKDGSRADHVIDGDFDVGHLCYSSAVKDVIVEDCLAFLRGESAESRGIRSIYNVGKYGWNHGTTKANIDLMPQDGWQDCQCPKCEAARRPKGEKHRSTELVWGFAADVSRRLKEKGFEPIITMMSYADYADIPRIDLPTNIRPMVALTGPWAHEIEGRTAKDVAYLRKWSEKLGGGKAWIWTYPNKDACNGLNLPDIPSFAPHAWGAYYKAVAPETCGIFTESECDKFLNNALGYYVVQRICWNVKTDVEAVIDEFYVRMFGAAAEPMRRVMELLERKFVKEIAADQIWTPIGPKANRPSDYRLWTEIYSAKVTDDLVRAFGEAAAAVPSASLEGRRVALFRGQFLDPLVARGAAYRASIDVKGALERYRASEPSENLVARDWIVGRPSATEDASVHVATKRSLKVTTTEKSASKWELFNKLRPDVTLKPGAKYRLSWFVRTALKPTERGGGAAMAFNIAGPGGYKKGWLFPKTFNYLSGTVDWIAGSGEIEIPADAPSGLTGCVMPFVRYAVGDTWYDGVRLEEIK